MRTVTAPSNLVNGDGRAAATSDAWRERSARLYEDLRRPARAMLRRAFGSAFGDDEIEDLYGNAWLGTFRALRRRHESLDDEEIRKYVLTAVAHHASKELRRRGRRPTSPLDTADEVADAGHSPEEMVADLEQSRVTRDLLASLPSRRRAVMLLRYGWGLDPSQVCGLVRGLSPRAYRKEITRGVDELAKKLRLVERGEWCADREPVLKAFAAGLADEEQELQARHHLAHCRHCTEFVGRLHGHLHDLGASLTLPGAADAALDGRLSIGQRLADLSHRIRESVSHPFARGGDDPGDAGSQLAGAAASTRGAGAAGGGVLAKLAGLGSAGKVAALCLGGGAAATACLAVGVVPVRLHGAERPPAAKAAMVAGVGDPVSGDPAGDPSPAAVVDPQSDPAPVDPPPAPEPAVEPVEPAPEPVPPPPEQQFGLAPATSTTSTTSTSSGASSTGTGGGTGGKAGATAAQFGP